jgi:hypothetical protein
VVLLGHGLSESLPLLETPQESKLTSLKQRIMIRPILMKMYVFPYYHLIWFAGILSIGMLLSKLRILIDLTPIMTALVVSQNLSYA